MIKPQSTSLNLSSKVKLWNRKGYGIHFAQFQNQSLKLQWRTLTIYRHHSVHNKSIHHRSKINSRNPLSLFIRKLEIDKNKKEYNKKNYTYHESKN